MKTAYAIAIAVVVLVLAGFGGYSYYTGSQQNGHLALTVADAPLSSSVSAVYITFSAVSIHNNSTGWTNYSVQKTTVNILGLTTSNASLLSNISLHAGKYTMIRLYISNVTVNLLGQNETFSLNAPFAFVNHPFTVSAHSTTGITIDFHLNQDLNLNSKTFTPYVGFVQQ